MLVIGFARANHGGVAELAYAADLKSASFGNEGSNPSAPTTFTRAVCTLFPELRFDSRGILQTGPLAIE